MKNINKVLFLLKKIPKGRITTYAELARATGTSPRAVGAIMRSNKHPEIYPCYKVVMSDGSIGGYCGSDIKNIRIKTSKLKKDGIKISDGKLKGFEKIVFSYGKIKL